MKPVGRVYGRPVFCFDGQRMRDWLTVALLATGIIGCGLRALYVEKAHASRAQARVEDSDAIRSPGPAVLQATAMQHQLALADLFWLGVVQELGHRKQLSDASWQRAEYRADVATDLDPAYFTAYHALSLALLAFSNRYDQAEALLQKGWTALPSRWEFPLNLGYSAYFLRGEPDLGADYLARGAVLPGAPPYLGALAGRMQFHSGDEAGAIMLLSELIEHLEEPARSEAETRLLVLKTEPRLEAYDRACRAWRERTGTIPSPAALEAEVGEPPTDLLDSPITFDEHCVARTQLVKTREFEARRRVGAMRKGAETKTPGPQLDIRVDGADQ